MKTIVTTIAATLLTVSVSAADIYHGFGDGNADLSPQRGYAAGFAGVQPGVGGGIDRYHGFADGNPDLFHTPASDSGTVGRASDNGQAVYVGPGLEF